MIKFKEKPWPIHVPAAAVIHEWQALFVFAERIKYVDSNKNNFLTNIVINGKKLFCLVMLF